MAKQYIDVLIDGKVYSLGGSETEGYVQQIATYLNGKIFQLKAQPGFLKMPEDYQSIMTYLNLADDYFKEKESAKALASDKESMEKETYRLKHEMVSTQMKLESLRNERTVSEEELCFWFIFRSKRTAVGSEICLDQDPLDIVFFHHRMFHRADFYGNFISVYFEGRDMFFVCTVRSAGDQFRHFLSATDNRDAGIVHFCNNVFAVIADIEFYAHRGPPCE